MIETKLYKDFVVLRMTKGPDGKDIPVLLSVRYEDAGELAALSFNTQYGPMDIGINREGVSALIATLNAVLEKMPTEQKE